MYSQSGRSHEHQWYSPHQEEKKRWSCWCRAEDARELLPEGQIGKFSEDNHYEVCASAVLYDLVAGLKRTQDIGLEATRQIRAEEKSKPAPLKTTRMRHPGLHLLPTEVVHE